ncbi:hypothetical protein [Nocardia gipuzkoensis]
MASETIMAPNREEPDDEDDHNPDSLPSSRDPSGTCPRCNRTSNFAVSEGIPIRNRVLDRTGSGTTWKQPQQVVALTCHGCGHGTAVIEELIPGPPMTPGRWVPLHWWPVPGGDAAMADVPANLAAAYQEGVRCVNVEAPHAAVAMFRNALAHIVDDKGSDAARKKKTLNLNLSWG